jgi:hypothetical protein
MRLEHEGGVRMGPGWMSVIIIAVLLLAFALLNVIEKGRLD